ncbi:probable serine/threonine-protein kinase vps15 isoform X2 [Musca domestica]|uniref:Probable serine/threonine-protein kinase vps15 isoform X2 n=1 Tax=Musca domestica TaxID=7370 RepID=A0ABM3VHS5_MUSDO|nr:probable serine/threonine-protein kinase vps15 isoform X2 [Musca domestica]
MSNSVVTLSSFNLLFLTQVLTVLTSTIKYNEYVTDKGENISIPCIADGNIMWVKENGSNNNTIIQTGKYLILRNVSASDRGIYVCFAAVTPRKSIATPTTNIATNQSSASDNVLPSHEESTDAEKESQDEKTGETKNATTVEVATGDEKPSVENNIENIKTKNASTTSMLPMPKDATSRASSSHVASIPTTETASPPASASASNKTMPATSSSSSNVSTSHQNTTTTTNATSSSISDSHNTSSNHNNTSNNSSSSSNYANNSSSPSPSEEILITTTTLLPPSHGHNGVKQKQAKESDDDANDDDDEDEDVVQEFQAFQKINLTVRTPPGPVSQLYFKASTILGFLVWRFNKTNSGGYPVRSFTAEFRNVSYDTPPYNSSFEHQWSRMDPINIAPNVRQMEVYRLEPNTTYEFRMWANNHLGSGEVVTTNVTTLPETKEEEFENGWDSIELIPNIILNPGFSETDDGQSPPIAAVPLPTFSRTIVFGDESDSCESESDHEPRMEKFKRKLSVFFTDPTIKRI